MDPSTIKRYDDKEFMDFQKASREVDDQMGIPREGREGFDDLVQDMRDEYMDSPEALEKAKQADRILMRKRRDGDMMATGGRPGLYANINAKRKRIAAGSGERMRKKGEKGAPPAENFRQAAKTAKRGTGGLAYKKGYYGMSYK